MDVETVGSIPPDEILQQAIKYLQEKLAAVIKTFAEPGGDVDGFGDGGVRSPGPQDYAMGGMDGGFGGTTPYGNNNQAPYNGFAGGETPYAGPPSWS